MVKVYHGRGSTHSPRPAFSKFVPDQALRSANQADSLEWNRDHQPGCSVFGTLSAGDVALQTLVLQRNRPSAAVGLFCELLMKRSVRLEGHHGGLFEVISSPMVSVHHFSLHREPMQFDLLPLLDVHKDLAESSSWKEQALVFAVVTVMNNLESGVQRIVQNFCLPPGLICREGNTRRLIRPSSRDAQNENQQTGRSHDRFHGMHQSHKGIPLIYTRRCIFQTAVFPKKCEIQVSTTG